MELAFSVKQKNSNKEVDLNKLDDSQRKAVEASEDKVVITASAGSGKTSTLITAIANHRFNYLNHRICAITYTRAARAEMESRLKELQIFDVEVTTIHVWARNLLNDFAIKYDFKVRVLEERDIKTILETLVNRYRVRHPSNNINIGVLYSYITGNKNMDVTDGYKRILANIEEMYIEYKTDNHLYDFTDYPKYLYDIMEYYNERVKDIDALFVDEFQDVDYIQYELFEKVDAKKKFYIGDSWQSIFQFRGADGQVFEKLEDFTMYKLDYNYRSYQVIVDYATTVYNLMKPNLDYGEDMCITMIHDCKRSQIKCARGKEHGFVAIIDNKGKMSYIYNDLLWDRYKNSMTVFNSLYKENAMFLCRTNKQVKALQELGVTNVSTIHQAKGLEYDNVIVIDFSVSSNEDLNIAYVALTRARNNMVIIPFALAERQIVNLQKQKSQSLLFGH